jgi:hypothetical protein
VEGKSQNRAPVRGPVLETESGNLRLSGFESSARPGLAVLLSSKFAALKEGCGAYGGYAALLSQPPPFSGYCGIW